jgi:hypothetical protein
VNRFGIQSIWSWNRAGLKKKQGKKKLGVTQWVDPIKPYQKSGCNLLTFVFFTKTTSFWFFFKLTRSKPGDPVKT